MTSTGPQPDSLVGLLAITFRLDVRYSFNNELIYFCFCAHHLVKLVVGEVFLVGIVIVFFVLEVVTLLREMAFAHLEGLYWNLPRIRDRI